MIEMAVEWSLRRRDFPEQVYLLPASGGTVAVGRNDGDIILPGSIISRFHAHLYFSDGFWNIVDLRVSTNPIGWWST